MAISKSWILALIQISRRKIYSILWKKVERIIITQVKQKNINVDYYFTFKQKKFLFPKQKKLIFQSPY